MNMCFDLIRTKVPANDWWGRNSVIASKEAKMRTIFRLLEFVSPQQLCNYICGYRTEGNGFFLMG